MRVYQQCRVNGDNPVSDSDYAVIFIGGFVDIFLGISWRQYHGFRGFDLPLKGIKGYYHWDGCHWGMLADGCHLIADDLNALISRNPALDIVLIGHSYGGSAAMEVARNIVSDREGTLIVLTLDAVSRRQSSERADGLDFWGNAYLSRGGGILDIVPRIGGRWGHRGDADANFAYDGYERDRAGNWHSHRDPRPMMWDTPDGRGYGESLLGMAEKRLMEKRG